MSSLTASKKVLKVVRFHYHHINLNIANVNSIVPEEGWFGQPKYSTKLILLFYVVSVSAFQFQFTIVWRESLIPDKIQSTLYRASLVSFYNNQFESHRSHKESEFRNVPVKGSELTGVTKIRLMHACYVSGSKFTTKPRFYELIRILCRHLPIRKCFCLITLFNFAALEFIDQTIRRFTLRRPERFGGCDVNMHEGNRLLSIY